MHAPYDEAGLAGWRKKVARRSWRRPRQRRRRRSGNRSSAGIAVHRDGEHFEAALTRADRALYDAKRAGRDRIVAAAPLT